MKNFFVFRTCFPLVIALVFAVTSCNPDIVPHLPDVSHLQPPPFPPIVPDVDTLIETWQDGNLVCEKRHAKASTEFSDFLLLNPNNELLPGSVFAGNSVADGSYQPITLENAEYKISSTLPGAITVTIPKGESSLSAVRTAIDSIVSSYKGVLGPPAQFNYEAVQVENEQQIRLHAATNIETSVAKITALFDLNNSNYKTHVMVRFNQVYFSIGRDLPGDMSEVFARPADFMATSPEFIPTVTTNTLWGRIAYGAFESKASFSDLSSALDVLFKKGSVGLSFDQEKTLKESRVNVFVMGGNAQSAIQSITGFDALREFIINGANTVEEAAMVGYTLRLATNGRIVNLATTSEYDYTHCLQLPWSDQIISTSNLDNTLLNDYRNVIFDQGNDRNTGSKSRCDFDFSLEVDKNKLFIKPNVSFEEVGNDKSRGRDLERFQLFESGEGTTIEILEGNVPSHGTMFDEDNNDDFLTFSSGFIDRVDFSCNQSSTTDLCGGGLACSVPEQFARYKIGAIRPIKIRVHEALTGSSNEEK